MRRPSSLLRRTVSRKPRRIERDGRRVKLSLWNWLCDNALSLELGFNLIVNVDNAAFKGNISAVVEIAFKVNAADAGSFKMSSAL